MNTDVTLLVVDDDLLTCTRHKAYFEAQGYQVVVAHDGSDMWLAIDTHPVAVVLLDVGLPGKDGLELARELRAHDGYLGIILVTSLNDDIDKIVGLESGANDYVTKPFNSRELLARVKIVLRETHHRRPTIDTDMRSFGRWRLDLSCRSLEDEDGAKLILSRGEMDLLAALARVPGTVLSRERLMRSVSQRPSETSDRTIDVLVSRLRKKLEADPANPQLLVTVRNEGYALVALRQQ
ncbi:MAG TPA: response regulator [Candidimonas sp.]|nr:response regulator [Candidimonas sp.]